jgi:drug/metabolite transporter (DMT)-like permease
MTDLLVPTVPVSTPLLVAVVLVAAFLHAGWNAIVKATADGPSLFTRMATVVLVLGLALIWWVQPPAEEAWSWLAASSAVHVAYSLGLLAAYRLGDFNQAYPLARGLGPIVVAIVAATALGEQLSGLSILGVVIIATAIGVLGLTPWHQIRSNRAAVLVAVGTGLTIATYTLIDGIGVRHSGSAVGYTVWLLTVHNVLIIVVIWILRRTPWLPRSEGPPMPWRSAFLVASMSALAYGLVIWAQSRGALAAVAALRESSVVIAALLGSVVFHEPIGRVRVAASIAVAAGIVLLALG